MQEDKPRLASIPFHPLLVGLFPILAFYSKNIGSTPAAQLWRPILVVTLGVIILWFVLNLFLKSRWKSALITSVSTLLFFSYEHAENFVARFWNDLSHGRPNARIEFLVIWVAVLVLVGFFLVRIKKGEKLANGFLNVVTLVLLLTSSVSAFAAYSGTQESESEVAAGNQSSPQTVAATQSHRPDVFYLLMDGYGREDTLKEYMGVDNTPFIAELRRRGFYVADKAHSNYAQTELSLPASLNMDYVQNILATMPNFPKTRTALEALVDYNTVSDEFRKQGYTYIYVSTGFPFFTGAGADVRTLGEVQGLTLFESSLVDLTPLTLVKSGFLSDADEKRKLIHSAFSTISSFGTPGPKPKFVFAHILLPHPPFVFWANGSSRKPDVDTLFDGSMYMNVGGTKANYVTGYSNQLLYANSQLLNVIDELLKNEKTPPIIIIQGDHGSRMLHDFNSMKDTDFRECMAILNAYYVPESVKKNLYPGVTPVNSFRIVLSTLFGEQLPVLPDRSYYSTWDAPTDFTDVTKQAQMADQSSP